MRTISLGTAVIDVVTKLKGTTTARVEYLNGCVQYAVQPPVTEDGKYPEATYIDVGRLIPDPYREDVDLPERQRNLEPGGVMSDEPSSEYRG